VLENYLKTQRIQFLTRFSHLFHVRDWQFQFSNGEFLLPNEELELNHRQIANFEKAEINLVSPVSF
jgi:hypothetical protein